MHCDYLKDVALHGEQEALIQLLAFLARVLLMMQSENHHVLHIPKVHHKTVRVELSFHGHLRDQKREDIGNRNMIVVSVQRFAKTLFLTNSNAFPTLYAIK